MDSIEWTDLRLVPAETTLSDLPEELEKMLAVGRPAVFDASALARAAGVELQPEITLMLDDHVFKYVQLPVSIRPRDKAMFRLLSVNVEIASQGQETICWSLQPERVEEEMKVVYESSLSAQLAVELVELGSSGKEQSEFVVYQPTIVGFNVRTERPGWDFRPTAGRNLNGIQMLHLVTRAPRSSPPARGQVRIAADVIHKGVLWNTKAVSADESHALFEFPI